MQQHQNDGQHRNVDPAALLVAVFTVGLAPLTEPGLWEKINTIVAGLVAVILFCFMYGRLSAELNRVWAERLAICLTLGFIVGIALAWPTQEGWIVGELAECRVLAEIPPEADASAKAQAQDTCANRATLVALFIGLGAAFTLFVLTQGPAIWRWIWRWRSQRHSRKESKAAFAAFADSRDEVSETSPPDRSGDRAADAGSRVPQRGP